MITQQKENCSQNMKKSSETEKTLTFFLKIWEGMMQKMEIKMCVTECLGQIQLREKWGRQWTITKIRGKTEKGIKLWKIFYVFFATGRSTHEGVASWVVKISVYPSWLDPSLANKSPKLTRELAAEACDLDDLRLSRQNRAILFLKFFSFCKNKILSKNN